MAKRFYERYALAEALKNYLPTDWGITEVKKGFQSKIPVEVPAVSVYFLPSRFDEVQMSRDQPTFLRRVQVDAYMEDEARADGIADDIADFFDLETISVTDPSTNIIAIMKCYDSQTIVIDTLPPNFADTSVKKWRGVVKAVLQVDYL